MSGQGSSVSRGHDREMSVWVDGGGEGVGRD